MGSSKKPERKVVCVNRKARHEYHVLDRFEAGLVLRGSEVKALREGKGNLADAYVLLRDGGPQLLNMEISTYSHDHTETSQPRRPRGLLMHAREIRKLKGRFREKGLTLVPLAVYFSGPWAKVEVGLCRGRRKQDKREVLRHKQDRRDMERAYRRRP